MADVSERQRRFVAAYSGEAAGNGVQAARLAGYEGTPDVLAVTASRLLRNAKVGSALREAAAEIANVSVADRCERQQFLTAIMRDDDGDVLIRMKAADLLNKMAGDYSLTDAEVRAAEREPESLEELLARLDAMRNKILAEIELSSHEGDERARDPVASLAR